MLRINYKAEKSFEKIIKDIEISEQRFMTGLMALGTKTAETMKKKVEESKKRPQAGDSPKLENAITVEPLENGWGVGNIDKLNREAPHWHFVNFGISQKGMIIPGRGKSVPKGQFAPGEGKPDPSQFQAGRWKTGDGNYSFQAKKGIVSPLDYIAKTVHWLDGEITKLFGELK